MDTKIYITGLALLVTWLVLEELKTTIYGFFMERKVMRLLDEMDDRPVVKPTSINKARKRPSK